MFRFLPSLQYFGDNVVEVCSLFFLKYSWNPNCVSHYNTIQIVWTFPELLWDCVSSEKETFIIWEAGKAGRMALRVSPST